MSLPLSHLVFGTLQIRVITGSYVLTHFYLKVIEKVSIVHVSVNLA